MEALQASVDEWRLQGPVGGDQEAEGRADDEGRHGSGGAQNLQRGRLRGHVRCVSASDEQDLHRGSCLSSPDTAGLPCSSGLENELRLATAAEQHTVCQFLSVTSESTAYSVSAKSMREAYDLQATVSDGDCTGSQRSRAPSRPSCSRVTGQMSPLTLLRLQAVSRRSWTSLCLRPPGDARHDAASYSRPPPWPSQQLRRSKHSICDKWQDPRSESRPWWPHTVSR